MSFLLNVGNTSAVNVGDVLILGTRMHKVIAIHSVREVLLRPMYWANAKAKLAVWFAAFLAALAAAHSYTDENGNVHYIDHMH